MLSIPSVCICLILANYSNLSNVPIAESDFTIVTSYSDSYTYEEYDDTETILKNIEKMQSVDGLENIYYEMYFNNYTMMLDSTKLKFYTWFIIDEIEYTRVSINLLSNINLENYRKKSKGNIDNYNLENHVLISSNISKLKYVEGDQIRVGNFHAQIHEESHNPVSENENHYGLHEDDDIKNLIIAGFIDIVQLNNGFFNIYVTEENFERITGFPPVPNIINVNVKDGADIEMIRSELYDIFAGELFTIIDNIDRQQTSDKLDNGFIILVVFICTLLFACVIILLWTFIAHYI